MLYLYIIFLIQTFARSIPSCRFNTITFYVELMTQNFTIFVKFCLKINLSFKNLFQIYL